MHDQMHMKYDVGHFPVKAWKYIFWYFVHTTKENAYILYCKTSTRQTKKKDAHLDFQLKIAMGLIAGFSFRKRKAEAQLYIGHVRAANENYHENVNMGSKKGKKCKWHCMQQMRTETVYGCHLCNVHLCKYECHIAYHNPTILSFYLVFFFLKLPLISPQDFSSA